MDNSLKSLENQLQNLVPRGLSDEGQENCERLIDRLANESALAEKVTPINQSPIGLSLRASAAAAAVTLAIGLGAGWHLGQGSQQQVADVKQQESYITSVEVAAEGMEDNSETLRTTTTDPEKDTALDEAASADAPGEKPF